MTSPTQRPGRVKASAPRVSTKPPGELSLGTPPAPVGENCDLRGIIAAAGDEQEATFAIMMQALGEQSSTSSSVAQAAENLKSLQRGFGDADRSAT
ncbi:hypothetical protein B6S44_28760 [Bosea sp. Tri-44]|nr:hypothetical protein B6S44_28760 [Bosea sp. Tri-44]